MPTRTHQIHVAASIEAVFDAMADVASHARWQEGLLRSECQGDPRVLGARGAEVRRLFGREVRFPWEITVYEPWRRWGFRALGGPIRPQAVVDLVPEGDGTRINSTLTIPGPLGWLAIAPLFRQQKKNYHALKQWLETAAASPSG